jgi:hypothetical protein
MSAPVQKITFAEMRAAGVHGVLIYCSDPLQPFDVPDADRWRMTSGCPISSPTFVCAACGRRGADILPDWQSIEPPPKRQPKTCWPPDSVERLPGGSCTHWKAPPLHGAHLGACPSNPKSARLEEGNSGIRPP